MRKRNLKDMIEAALAKEEQKELSIKEIARLVRTNRITASKYLAILEAQGKVEQIRSVGNARFYRINPRHLKVRTLSVYKAQTNTGFLMKSPGIRNVALRAKTISLLLDEIRKGMGEEDYRTVLSRAGFQVGKDFVKNFQAQTGGRIDLTEWAEYDLTAGWGRFEFIQRDNHVAEINVRNSFEAFERKSAYPLCYFLKGYLEGVLQVLENKAVTVREVTCIAKGDEICKFVLPER